MIQPKGGNMKTSEVRKSVLVLKPGTKIEVTFKRQGFISDMWYLFRAIQAGYFTAPDELKTYLRLHWKQYPNDSVWPPKFTSVEKRTFVVRTTGQAFDPNTFPPHLAESLEGYRVIG